MLYRNIFICLAYCKEGIKECRGINSRALDFHGIVKYYVFHALEVPVLDIFVARHYLMQMMFSISLT